MKRTDSIVINWGLVILWMIVIFSFSTESFSSEKSTPFLARLLADLLPDALAQRMDTIVYLIRKLSHWSEYFILGILLMRALNPHISKQPALRRMVWSILLATLYAATDEYHQTLVPGRSANSLDIVIDSFGALCGTLWCHLRNRSDKSSSTSPELEAGGRTGFHRKKT
jgi:VanZ family protein